MRGPGLHSLSKQAPKCQLFLLYPSMVLGGKLHKLEVQWGYPEL